MKKIATLISVLALIALTACSVDGTALTDTVSPTTNATSPTNTVSVSVSYDSDDLDSSVTGSTTAYITLKGVSITLDGSGAVVSGSSITVTSAGTYSISGTLDDGQIIVDTEDEETVKLILNGVDVTCSTSAPIYVANAEKTVITLADGSKNYITDGDSYIFEDVSSDEPNAAVFSHDDLTINGNGSLTVNANYNNGIQSKDDLKIIGGNITVNAANDGIKGRDSISVMDGSITVEAGGDGMQSNNDEDSARGYVYIEGGTIKINAGEDGIQAETNLVISGGDITISSGGGSANSSNTSNTGDIRGGGDMGNIPNAGDADISTGSAKGLKAGVDLTITDGIISIDSADDSIHSNDSLTIDGGDIILASGDDGIHSDSTLEINGGDISITKCYEGIESSNITINEGNIYIVASDDGINAASGDGGDPMMGGWPGPGNLDLSGDNSLYISGGYIVVDANGDGFDINGAIDMTGGVAIINGPTTNMEGALDYYNSFAMSGGFLIAIGSAGMAMAPSTSSTQYSVMINHSSSLPAGTMFHVENEDGEDILTIVPAKAYQSVVLCSPELEMGETYFVYSGGSSTGTASDGLYSGGTYTAGTQITSFTISSMVTSVGSAGGSFPGGGQIGPGGRR